MEAFFFFFFTQSWYLLNGFCLFLRLGGTCQSPALPALVRPPAPPLQPSLDIKPFLPFPLDTAAAVNLFPNFNAVSTLRAVTVRLSEPQFPWQAQKGHRVEFYVLS